MEPTDDTTERAKLALERQSSNQGIIRSSSIPSEKQAKAIGHVLDRFRFSQGWQPLPTDDHNRTVMAFHEILDGAKVPPSMYGSCYQAYMQRRAELKSEGKDVGPMAADDLVAEWWRIRRLNQEIDNTRLLTANASGTCRRCYGTGKEEMEDGTVRDGCEHLPMDEEENRARTAAAIQRGVQFVRDATAKIGNSKPSTLKLVEDQGQRLKCSACGRKVNTLMGWQAGETCGRLIDDKPCDGQMNL